MDQIKLPRLREACNDTCAGEYVICKVYCRCMEGYAPTPLNQYSCSEITSSYVESPTIGTDPTMIGVVIGLALMSITLCIVMQLFARARFQDNRSIFNTANPRLMNASLKTSKAGRATTQTTATTGGAVNSGSIEESQLASNPVASGDELA